jgi:hypothetical protein
VRPEAERRPSPRRRRPARFRHALADSSQLPALDAHRDRAVRQTGIETEGLHDVAEVGAPRGP